VVCWQIRFSVSYRTYIVRISEFATSVNIDTGGELLCCLQGSKRRAARLRPWSPRQPLPKPHKVQGRSCRQMRAALNSLAIVATAWLQALAPLEWYDRYSRRVENYQLPKTEAARKALAAVIGA